MIEGIAWTRSLDLNLNQQINKYNFYSPCSTQLSVKLILRQSQWHLTIAFMVPLVLSLVVATWYILRYNDSHSAFTVSSYIISAGAFIIALLAVLSALSDAVSDP